MDKALQTSEPSAQAIFGSPRTKSLLLSPYARDPQVGKLLQVWQWHLPALCMYVKPTDSLCTGQMQAVYVTVPFKTMFCGPQLAP
jgi:hypothetical protein